MKGYLAKEKGKRVINPPRRYAYTDLIAYPLKTTLELSIEEPKIERLLKALTRKVEGNNE